MCFKNCVNTFVKLFQMHLQWSCPQPTDDLPSNTETGDGIVLDITMRLQTMLFYVKIIKWFASFYLGGR